MATIKDVSRLANVSISTVSRVINKSANVAPDKEKAVLKAMQELNFQPNSFAQALVNKRSNCIGVLIGDLCGGPFFAQMMRGIENIILPENKYVIVMSGNHRHDREKYSIEALLLRRCDAIIVHSKAMSDDELTEICHATDIPMVFVNRQIPGLEKNCVWVDIASGVETAVNYLIENGHKHIAYIGSEDTSFPDAKERLGGYKEALNKAGLEFDENLISTAFPDENGGSCAVESLLSRKVTFTALVAYNDAMAVGCLSALAEHDIAVPSAVSVIGFDNNPTSSYVKPKLTTVRYPIEEVGERAAKLALAMVLAGEEDNNEETVEIDRTGLMFTPDLIVRSSVSAVVNEKAKVIKTPKAKA